MAPRTDFHVHTEFSNCAARDMTVERIVAECDRLGFEAVGIADHLYGEERLADQTAVLGRIRSLDCRVAVYFGVEAGYGWKRKSHIVDAAMRERCGFQYVIGSHHSTYLREYDLDRIIRTQHEYHLATCRDPNVDVLGHPWRFLFEEFKREGWPWFDTMKLVPADLTRELGRTARETGTAVEINTTSNLTNVNNPPAYRAEYVEYLSILAAEGVTFALASDAHQVGELATIEVAWDAVRELGLPEDRIWRPDGPPAGGGNRPAP